MGLDQQREGEVVKRQDAQVSPPCPQLVQFAEDYVANQLADGTRAAYEDHLVACHACQGEIEMLEALRAGLLVLPRPVMARPRESRSSWPAWLRWPSSAAAGLGWAAFGASAASLPLALVLLQLASVRDERDFAVGEAARLQAQLDGAARTGDVLLPAPPPPTDASKTQTSAAESLAPAPTPSFLATMILPLDMLRGDDPTADPATVIPAGIGAVTLSFDVPPLSAPAILRLTLSDARGRRVHRQPASPPSEGTMLGLTLPAASLPDGRYSLVVERRTTAGTFEPLVRFPFRVTHALSR